MRIHSPDAVVVPGLAPYLQTKQEQAMKDIVRIDSINQLHDWAGLEKPEHPLITCFDHARMTKIGDILNRSFVFGFYSIHQKELEPTAHIRYGRQSYDFQEGSMMFLAPEQTLEIEGEEGPAMGWSLCFHPDLIRSSGLGRKMKDFSFFSYDVHEALHVSAREKETLAGIAAKIEQEYSAQLDDHSHTLIISNLELFLNYCNRYYGRQFITRASSHHDVIAQFESFLADYFESDRPKRFGPPSAAVCAEAMRYSSNYLSDLLKKETGKTTLEHIHLHLIDRAKTMLVASNDSVREISQKLGFEYAQYFSRFFKKHTGQSPAQYRNVS